MATGKKFYWLKLSRDFFKRHDIRIIEAQENGKDYILFYIKLLVESIDHEGALRFSDTVPYDEKMLSVITGTNVDVVRQAIKIFTELKLMEIFDDRTIYMNEVAKMLGHETDWAKKKRIQREIDTRDNVPTLSPPRPHDVRQELEIEIEKELDKEKKKKESGHSRTPSFKKPTVKEVYNYCKERNNKVDPTAFHDFYESKNWMVGKNKMKDWKASVRTWEQRDNNPQLKKSSRPDVQPDWLHEYIQEQETK